MGSLPAGGWRQLEIGSGRRPLKRVSLEQSHEHHRASEYEEHERDSGVEHLHRTNLQEGGMLAVLVWATEPDEADSHEQRRYAEQDPHYRPPCLSAVTYQNKAMN